MNPFFLSLPIYNPLPGSSYPVDSNVACENRMERGDNEEEMSFSSLPPFDISSKELFEVASGLIESENDERFLERILKEIMRARNAQGEQKVSNTQVCELGTVAGAGATWPRERRVRDRCAVGRKRRALGRVGIRWGEVRSWRG